MKYYFFVSLFQINNKAANNSNNKPMASIKLACGFLLIFKIAPAIIKKTPNVKKESTFFEIIMQRGKTSAKN